MGCARHKGATDGYYEWYGQNELKEEACLYHMCLSRAPRCKTRLPRGDRRILIHVDRWRMLTPEVMVGVPYLKEAGVKLGEEALDLVATEKAKAPASGVPPGTAGLDAALAEAGIPPLPPDPHAGEAPGRKDPRGRSPRSRSRGERRGMGRFLREQGEEREKRRDEDRKHHGSRKRRKEKKTRRDKRKRMEDRSSSYEGEDRSSDRSDSLFQEAPARGSNLVQIAKKKPGHLLKQSLLEMGKFLAEREDSFEERESGGVEER